MESDVTRPQSDLPVAFQINLTFPVSEEWLMELERAMIGVPDYFDWSRDIRTFSQSLP